MSFKFSLQPVLQQRLAQEEKRQREYGEAQTRVEAALQRQEQVRQDIQRWVDEIRQRQGTLDFARRELMERWIGAQYEKLARIAEEIVTLARLAEQCRLRLVKAMQERTVMEKLHARELAAWRQEEERAERRFFDEIGVRDFIDRQHREKDAGLEERIAG